MSILKTTRFEKTPTAKTEPRGTRRCCQTSANNPEYRKEGQKTPPNPPLDHRKMRKNETQNTPKQAQNTLKKAGNTPNDPIPGETTHELPDNHTKHQRNRPKEHLGKKPTCDLPKIKPEKKGLAPSISTGF